MKAPDKIYINNYNGNETWGNQWHTKPSTNPSTVSHEYIRKDALLEWVKGGMNINLEEADEKNDMFSYGVATGFAAMIDKLNSM